MVKFSPFRTDRRFPEIKEVDAYWTALKGARAMPARRDINPNGIENALPRTFILQRTAPGQIRFRLVGQDLRDMMGMDLRGMPLGSLFSVPFRDQVADLAELVLVLPAVAELKLTADDSAGRPGFGARMKLWPLTDDQDRVSRVIGALSYPGSAGGAPRRFEIESSRLTRLQGASVTPVEQDASLQHSHLRLVKTI